MIDLRLRVDAPPLDRPLVVRLRETFPAGEQGEHDAFLIGGDEVSREFDFHGFSLTVYAPATTPLDGDVLLIPDDGSAARRLVRAGSKHNTFLVTEQCDQLCVMCSQPPKKYHVDIFEYLEIAAQLAPQNAYIGITGGEPLLHKEKLFRFLRSVTAARPDLRFHILSNGQFFEAADMETLADIGWDRMLWGIPLYAADATVHDAIVGKQGAFEKLQKSFQLLLRAGALVELRTVILRQNWAHLPGLASYVTTRLPFIDVWALMQLENIGYGRMNWSASFQDTSLDFSSLKTAVNVAIAHDIRVSLYNFPLCSVPKAYRHLAPSTISDWKRKYLEFCDGCAVRSACGGFFEWYKHTQGFGGLAAQ
ncbi:MULTISPECIES: His-Xaa-Ser system radical SAM maturase HxsC [unclassified Rhizobium]|uniref:His-Xaa-Ser system radical SAM maturase HxsC n=1 Tax=unclassified Rhizobium TaxID=2613769 RepID=UPI001ADC8600|nr:MULTISPECIES: His-Xaa-Ser system radical SAM maturase HxsC [unclassified Rhizobium]MBO9102185.1 His-Xaa-Ser system radical SAM maturase HxsC [Rhizobium sp. L58/93]MBO9172281.1 His-Xaa-Ser system radical SAM maturase HxsC [Rhizobium sp. L245/93]MBO9188030.1 His-Xaa-Ser system radical SAM maturase HxsC [Rhizobium sp. E27B/91]QXZ86310.1 His-Xaa-Ser system radical SAM maturase HxsC [Rhizobium sp. K1/93]QXZ92235.1 His-Xaa-Ser system radical SAM maturase HxsC [Rhizobium sp. K15/93]